MAAPAEIRNGPRQPDREECELAYWQRMCALLEKELRQLKAWPADLKPEDCGSHNLMVAWRERALRAETEAEELRRALSNGGKFE